MKESDSFRCNLGDIQVVRAIGEGKCRRGRQGTMLPAKGITADSRVFHGRKIDATRKEKQARRNVLLFPIAYQGVTFHTQMMYPRYL